MSLKAQPQNIEFTDNLKFASSRSYVCDHPKGVFLDDNYFSGCVAQLAAGDEIRVTCIRDDATWDKAMFEVIVSMRGSVVVEQIGDWRHGGVQLMGGLKAKHMNNGVWNVYRGKLVVASGLSKAQAKAMAPDDMGLEDAAD